MQNMRPIITHRRHHTRQRKKTISASCALYILHSCWALHIWHSCPPSYFLAFVIEPMSVLTTSSVLHGFHSSPSLCIVVERTSNHLKYPQPLFPYNTKYTLLKRDYMSLIQNIQYITSLITCFPSRQHQNWRPGFFFVCDTFKWQDPIPHGQLWIATSIKAMNLVSINNVK